VASTFRPATADRVEAIGMRVLLIAEDMRAGSRHHEARDDTAFAFVARIDKADRETVFENEKVWQKSLPALGETFPIENIRETVASALLRPSTKSSVLRLYFGVDTASADFWIDEEKWAAVQGPVDETMMRNRFCRLALDLSQKNDLTAVSAAWEPIGDEPLAVKSWYWTAAGTTAGQAARPAAVCA
jgi:phage terminase large subunit-like protein